MSTNMTQKSADDWVLHREVFDGFEAVICGPKKECRLTIFRNLTKVQMRKYKTTVPSIIVYQADAKGTLALLKLKKKIGDFRYEITSHEYEHVDLGLKVKVFPRF